MPSKRSKADVGAKAAERLPRLPDELWAKIFRDVADPEEADLAALRLVNKYCAKMFAHRQYGRLVRRIFRRKRRWRIGEFLDKAQLIQGTPGSQRVLKERARLQSRLDGELAGDMRTEQFIWELGTKVLEHTEAIPFLKACIDTLRELNY